MKAIAAISKNGVIGRGGDIPWRIPEEFKWFRRMTFNSAVIMGRRTFQSLPKPLVGRVNVVLTRHPTLLLEQLRLDERYNDYVTQAFVGPPAHRLRDVVQLNFPQIPYTKLCLVRGILSLKRAGLTRQAWLCGGAQIYQQILGECSELYLSIINREVEGDTFFPPFEHLFDSAGEVAVFSEFRVVRYVRKQIDRSLDASPGAPETSDGPLVGSVL
jgi:dihydrofolate reductase